MGSFQAPYGTWSSPITTESITKAANRTVDIVVDRITSEVYHLESRPSEKGRSVLVHTASNHDVVGPSWNIRTAVQEYGGAPAIVHDSVVYFSHLTDSRIYHVRVGDGAEPEAITPENAAYRYACLEPHPSHAALLFCVFEDHTNDIPSEVVTTIVAIDTVEKKVRPVLAGADFYASPKVSPDGTKLSWIQWSHPDMPWEGGEVHMGDINLGVDNEISIHNPVHIAGSPGKVAAGYPSWATNDTLIFTSDESGFSNPWKYTMGKATPLLSRPVPQEFGHAFWQLHYFPYAVLAQGKTGLFSALKDGRDVLYLIDLDGESEPKHIDTPFVVIDNIRVSSAEKDEIVFTGQKPDEMESIVKCSLSPSQTLNYTVLGSSPWINVEGVDIPKNIISEPRPITLSVQPSGEPLYTVYYPPHNPKYSGSSIEGEKPPCIVNVHGGPTGLTAQGLSWGKQYFTSRGWAWLDVNYGGSSGFGRSYVERLVGNWGLVDVQDCIHAPQSIASDPYNLVDPKRLIIRGGSAGGFTVLAALSTSSDVTAFAAATSSYGISDLNKLAEFTHKFESQYMYHLLGGTPEQAPEVYHDRSPINYANNIVIPLLILQGELDMVVPKGQAEAIYKSIQDRGGIVEYKLYAGEGHGWRQEDNIRDAYERELGFYERVLGLKK